MPMSDSSSLDEALQSLEKDLTGSHSSIAAQSGIPFAILRYAPTEEFVARRMLRLFAHSLEQHHHRRAVFVSVSRFVWDAVRETDGTEYLFETECQDGVLAAEDDIHGRLTPGESSALAQKIIRHLNSFSPKPDVMFLVRTGGIAPHIYRSSALLDELHKAGLTTPTILCYPGSALAGTDLRFYDLPSGEGLGAYNYRVKIYGTN
jgi:hypothetical protein